MQKIRNPVCASFFEVAKQAHSVPQFYFRFFSRFTRFTVSVDNLQESAYTGRSYAARLAPSANSYLPKAAPGKGSGRRVAIAPGDAGCREPAPRDASTGSSSGSAAQLGIHRKYKGNVPRPARFAT